MESGCYLFSVLSACIYAIVWTTPFAHLHVYICFFLPMVVWICPGNSLDHFSNIFPLLKIHGYLYFSIKFCHSVIYFSLTDQIGFITPTKITFFYSYKNYICLFVQATNNQSAAVNSFYSLARLRSMERASRRKCKLFYKVVQGLFLSFAY